MSIQHTRRQCSGFSLIEVLVVLVILMVLAAILMPRYLGNARAKNGKAASALARAHDTECLYNIRSVRQAIEVSKAGDPDAKNPASLTELRELPKELLICPVGKVPYRYNPETGEVHCPYPGHENY